MKRVLIPFVIVGLLATCGVLAWRLADAKTDGQTDGAASDDRVRELTEQAQVLATRLDEVEARSTRLERALVRQRRDAIRWASAAEEAQVGARHILEALRLGYGFPISDSCSYPQVSSIEPRILRPAGGSTVEGPVVVEIIGADPFWCDPTYYLTVDGVPYQHDATPKRGVSSLSNPHPMEARPNLPRRRWSETCMGGSAVFLGFKLQPGPHTIRVNGGCTQGTRLPETIPVEATFTVR